MSPSSETRAPMAPQSTHASGACCAGPALPPDALRTPGGEPAVVVTRTTQGWAVVSRRGSEPAADLVEALSLADLVVEELGWDLRPADAGRRAARGPSHGPEQSEPLAQEIAALRRTVEQLEHALSTRVTTERAIGVLAERECRAPRDAFEELRRSARSSGRLVHDLAREVLASLPAGSPAPPVPRRLESVPAGELGVPAGPPSAPREDTTARSGPRRVTRNRRPVVRPVAEPS